MVAPTRHQGPLASMFPASRFGVDRFSGFPAPDPHGTWRATRGHLSPHCNAGGNAVWWRSAAPALSPARHRAGGPRYVRDSAAMYSLKNTAGDRQGWVIKRRFDASMSWRLALPRWTSTQSGVLQDHPNSHVRPALATQATAEAAASSRSRARGVAPARSRPALGD